MPDLSDKVSELEPCPMCGASAKKIGPDPRGLIYCECVDCGVRGPWLYMGHGGTSEEAIAAWNRRTRPHASSMEGWRLVPEAATAQMLADVLTKTEASPEDYQLAAAAKALVPPTNDPRLLDALAGLAADYRSLVAASPIPPEVMK